VGVGATSRESVGRVMAGWTDDQDAPDRTTARTARTTDACTTETTLRPKVVRC